MQIKKTLADVSATIIQTKQKFNQNPSLYSLNIIFCQLKEVKSIKSIKFFKSNEKNYSSSFLMTFRATSILNFLPFIFSSLMF